MPRFVRFVAAVFGFPFLWALGATFIDVVGFSSGKGDAIFSIESIALFSGLIAFLAVYRALPDMSRIYVLGHELTHAVWGLAFGAKVSNLKVRAGGGSVTLTKSNVWITLAPYFFPFWTVIVVLLAVSVRVVLHFAKPEASFPLPWLWMFAVGFTWCFHVCFTIRSLMQTQPDVQEYGRIFSWVLILLCNIAGMLLWIVCTTDVSVSFVWNRLAVRTAAAYRTIFQLIIEWGHLLSDAFR